MALPLLLINTPLINEYVFFLQFLLIGSEQPTTTTRLLITQNNHGSYVNLLHQVYTVNWITNSWVSKANAQHTTRVKNNLVKNLILVNLRGWRLPKWQFSWMKFLKPHESRLQPSFSTYHLKNWCGHTFSIFI